MSESGKKDTGYEKPKVERYGDFRELTRGEAYDCEPDCRS